MNENETDSRRCQVLKDATDFDVTTWFVIVENIFLMNITQRPMSTCLYQEITSIFVIRPDDSFGSPSVVKPTTAPVTRRHESSTIGNVAWFRQRANWMAAVLSAHIPLSTCSSRPSFVVIVATESSCKEGRTYNVCYNCRWHKYKQNYRL